MELGELAARYCVRQNAGAFLASWAFTLVLGGGAIAGMRTGRPRVVAVLLLAFAVLTAGLTLWAFRWCAASVAVMQGMMPPASSHEDFDLMGCLTRNMGSIVLQWIVGSVAFLGMLALVALGTRTHSLVMRATTFLGAALVAAFIFADAFFLVFTYSWCGSHRLF